MRRRRSSLFQTQVAKRAVSEGGVCRELELHGFHALHRDRNLISGKLYEVPVYKILHSPNLVKCYNSDQSSHHGYHHVAGDLSLQNRNL